MFRYIAMAVLSLVTGELVEAQEDMPTSTFVFVPYGTMDEAAVAAERLLPAITTRYERAGVVVIWEGKFYYTSPVGTRDGYSSGSFHIRLPKDAKIVALYHDHPHGVLSTVLSPEDVEFANDKGWVSYVGMFDNNSIVRYTPGMSRTHYISGVLGTAERDRVADGDFVAKFLQ